MPKTILIDRDLPDMKYAPLILVQIDESVLDEVHALIERDDNYLLLRNIIMPQEDFSLLNCDIPKLHLEIFDLLQSVKGKTAPKTSTSFLCILDGFCVACEKTGQNIYGLAD